MGNLGLGNGAPSSSKVLPTNDRLGQCRHIPRFRHPSTGGFDAGGATKLPGYSSALKANKHESSSKQNLEGGMGEYTRIGCVKGITA